MMSCCCADVTAEAEQIDTSTAVTAEEKATPSPELQVKEEPAVEEKAKEEIKPQAEEDPKAETQAEQPKAMKVVFTAEGGVEVEASFTRKPMGFRFMNVVPVVVTKVDAGFNAEELGVKPGMTLKSIAGVCVDEASGKAYADVVGLLKAGLEPLPEQK